MKLGALWHRVVQDAMHSIKRRPNASQRLSKDGEETQKAELPRIWEGHRGAGRAAI